VQARSLSGGITIVTATVGLLALAACGSDRGGVSTAPTAIGPSNGAIVTARDHDDSHGGSIESTVTSLVSGTSCPTLSFMAGTTKVSVTAATVFEEGTCASIVVGAKVEVQGTRQPDNSILAARIEVEGNENEVEEHEGEGIITSLKAGTACPTLTFFIGSNQISVTAATMFEHGTCADLTVGRRVHVKANLVGGVFVATRIEIQNESPGHPEIEGDARISSLVTGTSCPTLQFKVEEWTVTLQASTVFVNGTCASIAVGKKVGVKGTVTSDHQVLATKIVFKDDDD
jgi:uncharacterized protein DUF5666